MWSIRLGFFCSLLIHRVAASGEVVLQQGHTKKNAIQVSTGFTFPTMHNVHKTSLVDLVAHRPVQDQRGSEIFPSLFAAHPDVVSIRASSIGNRPEELASAFWNLRERISRDMPYVRSTWNYRFTRAMVDYLIRLGLSNTMIGAVQGYHYLQMRNKSAERAKARLAMNGDLKRTKEAKRREYIRIYRAKKRLELQAESTNVHSGPNVNASCEDAEMVVRELIKQLGRMPTALEIEQSLRDAHDCYPSRSSSQALRVFLLSMGYDSAAIRLASGARTRYLRDQSQKRVTHNKRHEAIQSSIIDFSPLTVENKHEVLSSQLSNEDQEDIPTSDQLEESAWWETEYFDL